MDFKHLTQFKDIIELDKRPVKLDERETFNVSWGIDENYQVGAAISIASILENNKQNKFTFHIIADYLDKEYIELLSQLATKYQTVIKLYHIDSEPLKALLIIVCFHLIIFLRDWIHYYILMLISSVRVH